jgi:hypothetical protein
MGARNRIGIGLSYRPARLHRLAELIPWNRFLGSLKVKKIRAVLRRPAPTGIYIAHLPIPNKKYALGKFPACIWVALQPHILSK